MSEKKHKRTFLHTFISERKQVGAVAPSSMFLVRSMCNKIDFSGAKTIVELGPGTGVFTSELLKRASDDCTIILFELNPTFLRLLNEKFDDPRLIVLDRSAEDILDVLAEKGISEVDAILSSLPLTVIPEKIRMRIVSRAHEALKTEGMYVQYQYSLSAKKLLERKFGKLKMGFVPLNIPPAFVYLGSKS